MINMSRATPTKENLIGRRFGKLEVISRSDKRGSRGARTTLIINGGVFNSTSDLTIYSYSYGNSFANTNITITGGTFEKNVAFGGGYKGDQETVIVTGGVFNGDLGRYLANDGWEDIAKP